MYMKYNNSELLLYVRKNNFKFLKIEYLKNNQSFLKICKKSIKLGKSAFLYKFKKVKIKLN